MTPEQHMFIEAVNQSRQAPNDETLKDVVRRAWHNMNLVDRTELQQMMGSGQVQVQRYR